MPPGVTILPVRSIASCIADGRRAGARAVVAVDPARDRVAREVDDVAAEPVELADDGVEDPADVGGQLLGAPLRPELVRERLGERREAADVGEQRGPADAVRHRRARRKGPAAIPGDVGRRGVDDHRPWWSG